MTTACAYAPQASAPAQGQEARKMRDNMRAISLGPTTRGQSPESAKLDAVVRELTASIEEALAMLQGSGEREDLSYSHIPPKPAFSVKATYRFVGKLKPRQFPVDQ